MGRVSLVAVGIQGSRRAADALAGRRSPSGSPDFRTPPDSAQDFFAFACRAAPVAAASSSAVAQPSR